MPMLEQPHLMVRCQADPAVTRIACTFEITGLDRVIPHAASLEEALAEMPEAQARPSADDRPQ